MAEMTHLTDLSNLPLSSNQRRLWISYQQDKFNPAYNIAFTYFLEGELNTDALKESLKFLFERQHTLFSVFKHKEGDPYIEIKPETVILKQTDFSELPADKRKEAILAFVGDESRKYFDIEKGPLYRLNLSKENDTSYYFHVVFQHLIFDGWSIGVFMQELGRIYASVICGKEILLEPLKYHSYDFNSVKDKSDEGQDDKELQEFWKTNLKDCPVELKFPFDFARKKIPSGLGCREPLKISETDSLKLKALAKRGNTTLFKTVLSILGILMQKYTGERDICIGVPVLSRRSLAAFRVLGLFVNTAVVRLIINEKTSFIEYVNGAAEIINKAISHSKIPFEKIVEVVNPERIPGVNPFFQISLSWVNNLSAPIELGSTRGKWVAMKNGVSPFDITFYMWENEGVIEGELECSLDMMTRDTVIRLRDHFLILINNLVENSDASIESLSMISRDELSMIETVNNTSTSYSKEKTLLHLFEERVLCDPDKIAIISDDQELTYSEVNSRVISLAGVLHSYNIGKNDFVGILLKRSPDLIICLLALFKTGAAYVPLNLTDPDNRIMSIIKAADIKFVITNDKHELDLKEDCKRLEIEQLMSQADRVVTTAKIVELNSSDPAYIIFTSGTTGTPKGVLVNHKSVINLVEWVNETFKISSRDKLLWITNLSFDLSVYDIFGILAAGGIIRILNDEDRQDPEKQYELLLNEGITFWDSAPQSLLQLTPFFNRNKAAGLYDSLRLVFLSGDWIPLSLPTSVKAVFPDVRVTGLGGATEATIWSNYFIIDEINPEWKSIPYGKPIQNSRYYILDDRMHHCRIKQPGNLYIGGECLALGYYNDPVLTESKFKSNPFSQGSKLYLTGDRAQWMADGNIEFLGRDDEQIKVRGYRVEIGEIKNVVLQNKAIKEAIIIPDKSDRHNIKVILFITTYDDNTLDVRSLKKEMRECLPEYMIPSDIIHYKEFPATSNGKIDSKTMLSDYLESLENGQSIILKSEAGEDVITLTPTQKIMSEIWSKILKKVNFSPTESFFDIGGNSLLAIRLINSVREQVGVTLSFKEFISNPTIIQSGNCIDCQRAADDRILDLVHLTDTRNLPLTGNQKRLWLISRLYPDLPSYIIGFTYKLAGSLNREVFHKSIEALFTRHHIIFSVIRELNGETFCDIIPSKLEIAFSDLSQLAADEKERQIKEIIRADSSRPFDLKKGPLYRLYLIMTAPDEYCFHISIHHIVFDGWSWSVLVNDLKEIYSSILNGKKINLEEPEFQQYDYAFWENNTLNSRNFDELREFWKENLKGSSPKLNFPYDFQCSELSTGLGSSEFIIISDELSAKLRILSKNEDASLFTTMMSAFGILMNKYSGDDDLNIGVPVAYRPHSKLENIFGMFVNTVVVRLKLSTKQTFREIIHLTNEVALNAIAHQELPFENVVEIVNPERSSNANPLFQVAFVWENNLDLPLVLDGIRSEKIPVSEGTTPFDLFFSMWENGEKIEGEIRYSNDLLKRETVLQLKTSFLILIKNLVDNPEKAIDSIPMISEEEKKIIEGFNSTFTKYPKDKTIAELFRDQAHLYPDKAALVFKESSLTYKELNERTNQLARTLMESGVNNNTSVGILAEKSLEMIIGILGILKSGGCYVPIDPEYPLNRINFIIRDSECKHLLTQDKFMNLVTEAETTIDLNSPTSYHTDLSDFEVINNSSDLAYIMYTSGTTGNPKGSMIPQYSVVRLVRNTNYIELTPGDRILLTGAIVFDATTFEIWGALLNGGTLYLADKETILNPRILGEALRNNNISILWLTSALFTQIADERTDIFGGLRYLLVGGDVLSSPHINKVRKDNPKLKVINGYGPTENTTFSTTYLIEKDFKKNIPIGKPISNSTAYILDNNMNYQPIGVLGELYVGGEGLSKGYLNREDLNNSSFIKHPFNSGERIYRTGDYARWLPDGNIEFHGRIDNQLKIRGFRVELEGIESTISQIEGVVETVIKPIKVKQGDYKLIAFLNVQESFKLDPKEINSQISTRLPSYMLPSAYRFMNGFPKTINGKTDRKALCFNVLDLKSSVGEDVNTLTPAERKIYDIFCEILKTGEISKYDNFFEIGGNSLLAISVFSKIEAAFNIELGLRVFFDSPRIGDLAEAINIHLRKIAKGNQPEKGMDEMSKIIEGEI